MQKQDSKHRVVVTGMGAITPLGYTVDEFWKNVLANQLGVDYLTAFDCSEYKVCLASEIKSFDPSHYIEKKEARRMDRYCQFALVAAKEAVEHSLLNFEKEDKTRAGVIFGTGVGGLITFENEVKKLEKRGPRNVSPLFIPTMISNIAAGRIAMLYDLKGDNYTVSTACSSGTHAIGEAFRKIKAGYLDVCITGGAEACISPIAVAGFANMTALSKATKKEEGSIPFDERRSGFVLGEGAGMLVLESLEHAKSRGATIYGEIVGYGASSDAYHITSPIPDGSGAAMSMINAMNEAEILPTQVDYINAHGTGTPLNDHFETLAIKTALKEHAYHVAINSTKSMTGHLLGAAGAVEAIVVLKSILQKKIHKTINLNVPDPKCDLDYVADQNRDLTISYALSNSLGFGGHNATLCFAKFEE